MLTDVVLRQRVTPPQKRIDGLEIRLARNGEEMEQALTLTNRLTKYHALTTTAIVVATLREEIVATASIIQDSPLGIPTGESLGRTKLREAGTRTVEVAAWAVKREHRAAESALLFPLFRFIVDYARHYLRADYLVIGVDARHLPLYRALFHFERLTARGPGAVLDLKSFAERMSETARHESHFGHVADYMLHAALPELAFPERRYYTAWDTVLDSWWLDHLFVRREPILPGLSRREAGYVAHLFGLDDDRGAFPERHETRYPVACPSSRGEVRNASSNGLMLFTSVRIPAVRAVRIDVRVAPDRLVQLGCEPKWKAGNGCYGLRILSAPPEWKRFIEYLDANAKKSHARIRL